ncbi:hypothetical protein NE237_013224 [Protea cynaroides]|uniref:Uncharacterized protein n=1 Tax=Protea cynaroides TaxID=273540 RepID=A0A9Q0H0J9_9MAGN|nr:hypothetical protein NE237_013224 [Protea cynaroides]
MVVRFDSRLDASAYPLVPALSPIQYVLPIIFDCLCVPWTTVKIFRCSLRCSFSFRYFRQSSCLTMESTFLSPTILQKEGEHKLQEASNEVKTAQEDLTKVWSEAEQARTKMAKARDDLQKTEDTAVLQTKEVVALAITQFKESEGFKKYVLGKLKGLIKQSLSFQNDDEDRADPGSAMTSTLAWT